MQPGPSCAGCRGRRVSRCGRREPEASRRATDVSSQDWFKERKLFQAFVTQMSLDNAQSPFLVMPNAVQMNKIMTTEIQNTVQGKKSAKQALDDAAAEWNKILAASAK